jgi:hypothetical protein
MEVDPAYFEIARRRMGEFNGELYQQANIHVRRLD